MNSNNKPKIFSDGFTGALAIIGGIVGTIVFVVSVFGEWYAEFDMEPTGLILGILTIALFLLPFVISVFIGGGIGLIAGGFLGVFIEFIINTTVSFVSNKREQARKKRQQKKASKYIRLSNKNIDDDILQLKKLRGQLSSSDNDVIASYNLCLLIDKTIENKSIDFVCLSYCQENYQILNQIKKIERKLEVLAEQYNTIGDIESANHYLSYIK